MPDPPITTIEVPRHHVQIDAVEHALGAERLVQAADADLWARCRNAAHRVKNNSLST